MVTGYDDATSSFNVLRVDPSGHLYSDAYVWETSSLSWVPAETTNGVGIVGVTNASDVRINPSTEESLVKLNGFSLPVYDNMTLAYTGSNLTSAVYKVGATTVATLTIGYTGSNITSIVRT